MRWLMLLLCALAAPAAAEVALADFARHPQYEDVQISPEGDYLAASAVVGGRTVLSLIHLADMKGVNIVARNGGEIATFRWVAPHRVMYSVGERFGGLEAPQSTGELYAVNADGSGAQLLFGIRAGGNYGATHIAHAGPERAFGTLIAPLRDDPRHALIASYGDGGTTGAYAEAYKIDLNDGSKVRVATAPMHNARFLADHKGNIRFAYGIENDQKQRVFYRADDSAEWTRVFDEADDGKRVDPLMFNRAGDAVYFECGGICRWDVATRKLETLWPGNDSEPTGLVATLDDLDAFAVRSEPGRPAVTLLDRTAPEAKLLVALMQQFGGEDVDFTSRTRDGSKAVVSVHGDTDPGAFYLYDAAKKTASFLLARRPWIKPQQMAPVEPIELAARDGLKLHGFLTRPTGKSEAKDLPLVVFVHGGPYGVRDHWRFDPYVQLLASRGYAVLQVNFRGSGGYGQSFVRAGFREWGGKMQDDVTDATRWAVAQGVADPARICIFGASYGGYAALEGAVKEPNMYRCAIGYVGVYDLRLMYSRGDVPQSSFGTNYLKQVLGEDTDELYSRSPIAHLDRLKANTMLIVGGADRRVPPVQGESLRAALQAHKVEPEWVYEGMEGHGFYDEKHVVDLYAKIVQFLDRQIGADSKHRVEITPSLTP
jgi:dipeptidyl aminopeptidase/acylaminoacyl peptidase